jgi:hypothetical protein
MSCLNGMPEEIIEGYLSVPNVQTFEELKELYPNTPVEELKKEFFFGSDSDDDDDDIYSGIYIPTDGTLSNISVSLKDIAKTLNTQFTDHISRDIGDYSLILFIVDDAIDKGLPLNPLATKFATAATDSMDYNIYGPAILIEDNMEELTLDKLSEYGL